MFIGEYQHNLDSKGRLTMPAKFRQSLGYDFVITRGLDGCLFGFPRERFQQIQEKLSKLPLTKKDARAFSRFFLSAATEVEIDKQGRINIPNNLIEFAKIDKECRVIGVSDRIEIWSSEKWDQFAAEAEENFEEIAEDLIDFNFDL